MAKISFKHKPTLEDVKKSMFFQIFEKVPFAKIILLYIGPVLGVGFISYMIISQSYSFGSLICCLIMLLLGPLTYLLVIVFSKKIYKQYISFVFESEYSFYDDYFEIVNERGSTKYFFTDIKEIRQNKDLIFIYIGPGNALPLSKTQLGPEVLKQLTVLFLRSIEEKCKFSPQEF